MEQQVAESVLAWLQETKDVISVQAPDVISQLFYYNSVRDIICLICAVSLIVFSIWTVLITKRKIEEREWDEMGVIAIVLAVIPFTIAIVQICIYLPDLIQIHVAPKLYIINALSMLLK